MKQRIVLLGPPASGKGTQADRLATKFGIPHVSTGALLRSESARGTSLGHEADSWTRRGMLIPDELAISIITTWIGEYGTKFLFDGFPRSVGQAEYLDAALATLHVPLDLLIVLELSQKEIRSRILSRLSCLKCGATFSERHDALCIDDSCPRCGEKLVRRNDDTVEALEKRLQIYHDLTQPVIGYYERRAPRLLHRLNAAQGSDAIFDHISRLICQECE